ncbi:MAG: hypothetical protein ACQEVA_16005 [Myxococcota bacterium]
MSVARKDIVTKIDQLDTPDEPSQRAVRDFLVEHAADHFDTLTANLSVTAGRTRRGLVRVLVELEDRRALLPLMRFVHDTAGDHREQDARAIATRHLTDIADEEDAGRLFAFFRDMRRDTDPFVRGYSVGGFGALGDPRAAPFVHDAMEDEHEFVREQASAALETLRDSDRRASRDVPDRDELEREIRSASGTRLRFLTEELVRHEHGFEIARNLLLDGTKTVMTAVQALRRIGDARTRDVARRFLEGDRPDSDRAAALRLLADFIEGDATPEERAVVRDALDERDVFVRLAGLEAAARSGDPNLVLEVIDRAVDDGLDGIETVAEGLAQARMSRDQSIADRVLELLTQVQLEMRHSGGQTWAMSAAYLLRALKRVAPRDWTRGPEAIEAALDALRSRPDARPIAVTVLELLLTLLPEDGLARNRRWHPDDIELLIRAARHHGDDLLPRVLEVIARAASPRHHDLGGFFERAIGRLETTDARLRLLRAIREVRPDSAESLLTRLADHDDESTKKAAEAALRRVRNDRGIIDVDFRRASKTSQDSSD